MPSPTKVRHPVHSIYRFVFHYMEPLLAFGGVMQLYFDPKTYLDTVTPSLAARLDHPGAISQDAMRTLYTQIWGGWLMIVFNDIVTLRVFEYDPKVWRCVLATQLISDVVWSYALYQDQGSRLWDVTVFNAMDWFTVVTTLIPLLLKITFQMGIGVDFKTSVMDRKTITKNA